MIPDNDDNLMQVPMCLEKESIVRGWGLQDKSPLTDTGLQEGRGLYNRPLLRPAYSRFRLNRTMAFVAPAKKTPWPSRNWIPTPPQRAHQVTKSGGMQTAFPGPYTSLQMQTYQRAIPQLQSGLSGVGNSISSVLGGFS